MTEGKTKAEEIYARQLGVTVKQLTALQRQEAFQKAALIEIAKAADVAPRCVTMTRAGVGVMRPPAPVALGYTPEGKTEVRYERPRHAARSLLDDPQTLT